MRAACSPLAIVPHGEAVLTQGFNLPARYVIHTPTPIWRGGKNNEKAMLHACYVNSLQLALEHDLKSIAFPLLAAGLHGYPADEALHIAESAINDFLENSDAKINVYIVLL